ncbi:MAG: dihydropteroate synthase [Bacteroidales bacterium]|nr:dihydropteroate synthase [Bacteroidales bacterium]
MNKDTNFSEFSIKVRKKIVTFSRPVVMGILNVTPDSFYDGGRHNSPQAMLAHAHSLLDDGADIIDVGVASSRPGAIFPTPDEEAQRLSANVSLLRTELPDAIISVDTCRANAARAAIEAGADIVNDIGGGTLDSRMFETIADLQVPYILMHTKGTPDVMAQQNHYDDIIGDLVRYFSERIDQLARLGVSDVWLDPGFGFAKDVAQNHELLRRLDELTTLFSQPVVTALSRKSMIYKPLGITPDDALEGTVALDTVALLKGTRVLRVHDPKPALQTIKLLEC